MQTGCRALLAAIFLMAALTKITDLAGFEEQIRLHAGLPAWLEWTAITILPWLELTCGVCLALGHATREAFAITTLLLAAFVIHGVNNATDRDCGCFLFPSLLSPPPPWWHVVRDVGLLAVSVLGWSTVTCLPNTRHVR